jgi:hypothetical protein
VRLFCFYPSKVHLILISPNICATMRHNVAQILTLDAMATSPKNETIRVRITEATKIELQVLADADNRILSDYIRIELEKMIAEKKLPKENT